MVKLAPTEEQWGCRRRDDPVDHPRHRQSVAARVRAARPLDRRRLTELAIGAQRTAGEGRTVLGRPNPKSETIRDYNLKALS